MWFNPKDIETKALLRIKKYNINKIEIEMANYCNEIMDQLKVDRISFCVNDFIEIMRDHGLKTDATQIRNILKESWEIASKNNSDYLLHKIDKSGNLISLKSKGRYYIIEREQIDKIL